MCICFYICYDILFSIYLFISDVIVSSDHDLLCVAYSHEYISNHLFFFFLLNSISNHLFHRLKLCIIDFNKLLLQNTDSIPPYIFGILNLAKRLY